MLNYRETIMQRTLMELIKQFAPEYAENQMQEKALIFENERYQKTPNKYKILLGIGVTAALGIDTCTQTFLSEGRCGLKWLNKTMLRMKKLWKQCKLHVI